MRCPSSLRETPLTTPIGEVRDDFVTMVIMGLQKKLALERSFNL
jgi:hypothetical protein